MARCAVHEYRSSRWNAQDSDYFASLCMYSIRLVTRTPCDRLIPTHDCDPLEHFKEMLGALFEFLDHLRTNPAGMKHGNNLLYLCEDMYGLVQTHPLLEPDLRKCVEALLALHTHPHRDMPLLDHSYKGRLQEHQFTLTSLCATYGITCPEVLPLLSRSYKQSQPLGSSIRTPYNLGNARGSHASILFEG